MRAGEAGCNLPPVSTDRELLAAWAQGDQDAGETLIERHFDALYRFLEMSAPSQAEDLLQDTFLACVEGHSTFRGDSSFRTFLFGIARNKVLMFWRGRAQRGTTLDFEELSLADLDASPTNVVARRQEEQALLTALRRIPIQAQLLLMLFYWEGLRGPQLAEVLEIPEGTVRTRIRRARELLEGAMAAEHVPDALARSTLGDLERWAASLRASFRRP